VACAPNPDANEEFPVDIVFVPIVLEFEPVFVVFPQSTHICAVIWPIATRLVKKISNNDLKVFITIWFWFIKNFV
jgi:hypothetical protein